MRIGTYLGNLCGFAYDFKNENEDITFGRKKLTGVLFHPKVPKSGLGVIFLNGWGAGLESYLEEADRAASRGYTALCFDYRGFGSSPGLTGTTLDTIIDTRAPFSKPAMEDTRDAIETLLKYIGKDGNCALSGHSFGGHISVLTEHRAIKARIAKGAPDYLIPNASTAKHSHVQIHTALFDPLANYYALFPLPPARRIYDRAKPPKQINVISVDGAEHLGFCNVRPAKRQKRIVDHYSYAWLERYLEGDKSESNSAKLVKKEKGVCLLRTDLRE